MIFIVFSAILFGLVHPGSKIILETGIDLTSFCLLYVLLRLVVQIPVVIRNGWYKISGSTQFLVLVAIGFVGALLQLTEFAGIAKGLPVPVVTLLVYSHPLWSIVFSRVINKERFQLENVGRVMLGLAGVSMVIGAEVLSSGYSLGVFFWPLVAGFFISLWVSLSKTARQKRIPSWTISFYYDLFAFITLLGIRQINLGSPSMSLASIISWVGVPQNLAMIVGYSTIIGLLPNLLFYRGSGLISAVSAGLLLLLEPVIATSVSSIVWKYQLSVGFWIGATFVLLAAGGPNFIEGAKIIRSIGRRRVNQGLAAIFIIFIGSIFFSIKSTAAQIFLTEIVPAGQSDYTVSNELKQISVASDLALVRSQEIFPHCEIKLTKNIKRGTEEELIEAVTQNAKKGSSSDSILVGLSRSNFARVAAKALESSHLRGISIGAATVQLVSINKNFVSIVSPWTSQWKALSKSMKEAGCQKENTQGFFLKTDHLSNLFKEAFESQFGSEKSLSIDSLPNAVTKECIFIGAPFSTIQDSLTNVIQKKGAVQIFGSGDWNYYSSELKKLLEAGTKMNNSSVIFVPTGWRQDINSESIKFTKQMKSHGTDDPSPVGAYTYDSVLLAAATICERLDSPAKAITRSKSVPFLRKYQGVAASGNFLSQMYIVKFQKEGKQ